MLKALQSHIDLDFCDNIINHIRIINAARTSAFFNQYSDSFLLRTFIIFIIVLRNKDGSLYLNFIVEDFLEKKKFERFCNLLMCRYTKPRLCFLNMTINNFIITYKSLQINTKILRNFSKYDSSVHLYVNNCS